MADASAITVLLVTTGSTAWEDEGRLCGATDLAMSEEGHDRFVEALAGVSGDRLDVVYCGPDEGSVDAGEMVAKRFGARKRVVGALREVGLGLWEGQRRDDLASRSPKTYKQWCENPASVAPPEGETVGEARERIVGEMCRLIEKARAGGQKIAFVVRPMAAAIANEALLEASADQEGGRPEGGFEWKTVWCERVRELRATCRAGAA